MTDRLHFSLFVMTVIILAVSLEWWSLLAVLLVAGVSSWLMEEYMEEE